MKKFITYLMVIMGVVAIGFGAYALVQNDEQFLISDTTKYVMVGEEFELETEWVNKRTGSKVEKVWFTNPSIISQDPTSGKFKAEAGGKVAIVFTTSNQKYRNVSCTVYIGDGSLADPFYIRNAEQLLAIGNGESDNPFTVDKSYQLISNIDLIAGEGNSGYVAPIGFKAGLPFNGNFNGGGYVIENAKIDTRYHDGTVGDDIGLFNGIGVNGYVSNLRLNNFVVSGTSVRNAGIITGTNYGAIERIVITNSQIGFSGLMTNVGGAVGLNSTTDGEDEDGIYIRSFARVDRVGLQKVEMGFAPHYFEDDTYEQLQGIAGNVGGVVGKNYAGIVVYTYAVGNVYLQNATNAYGGIVGLNEYGHYWEEGSVTDETARYSWYTGANLKDSYASVNVYHSLITYNENLLVGGVIGKNIAANASSETPDSSTNRIIGSYYDADKLQVTEFAGTSLIDKPIYFGVGQFVKNGTIQTDEKDVLDKAYETTGEETSKLKMASTYVSHVSITTVYVEEGGVVTQKNQETIVPWNFATLWRINPQENESFPNFSMENIKDLLDGIYSVSQGKTISNATELLAMKYDGDYVIIADIDLAEVEGEEKPWYPWVPMGDTKNPFAGTLSAARYIRTTAEGKQEKGRYTIFNLTSDGSLNEHNSTYGGLFGVTTGRAGGLISDLVFQDVNITNYEYSGAVSGSNGALKMNMRGKLDILDGIDMRNITVRAGTIHGTVAVGAITGFNMGTILGAEVGDYIVEELSKRTTVISLTPAMSNASVGGIVGENNGSITKAFVKDKTEIKVMSETPIVAYAGGIVGYNKGLHASSQAIISQVGMLGQGVYADAGIMGNFGGIAGLNEGIIEYALVQTAVVSDTAVVSTFAGGVVGISQKNGKIRYSQVEKSSVEGYNAGGFIGKLEYADFYYDETNEIEVEIPLNFSFDAKGNLVADESKFAIVESGVSEGAVLGVKAGGFASIITNGLVRDIYVKTAINGLDKESVKAGLVAEIAYAKNDGQLKAGAITRAYIVATFNDNGKTYAVSQSEFLKDPFVKEIPVVNIKFDRTAGFITNYIFNDDTDGNAAKPQSGNIFADAWDWLMNTTGWAEVPYAIGTNSSMIVENTYKKLSFSSSVWYYKAGEYPSIASLNNLQNNDKNAVNVVVDVTKYIVNIHDLTDEPIVTYVNGALTHLYYVPDGETFTFSLTEVEGVSLSNASVYVNGIKLNADEEGRYVITNIYEAKRIQISVN